MFPVTAWTIHGFSVYCAFKFTTSSSLSVVLFYFKNSPPSPELTLPGFIIWMRLTSHLHESQPNPFQSTCRHPVSVTVKKTTHQLSQGVVQMCCYPIQCKLSRRDCRCPREASSALPSCHSVSPKMVNGLNTSHKG